MENASIYTPIPFSAIEEAGRNRRSETGIVHSRSTAWDDSAAAMRTGSVDVRVTELARQAVRRDFVVWGERARERKRDVVGRVMGEAVQRLG